MVAWGGTMAVNVWSSHVSEWSAEQRSMCAGSSCTGTTLRAETASMEVTQPPKPREARAVCFLSQQLPRWCCQPQGELLGSCVWQSFFLEMCSKCLPCPWHWQSSHDTGEEYSLPVPGGCPCFATYQDCSDLLWEAPNSVFPLPVCPSSYPMYTFHVVQLYCLYEAASD